MKNITVSVDEETARWARVAAAKADTSLSQWVGMHLKRLREGETAYEYHVTVTRKLRPGLSREQARADVGDLHSWDPVTVGPSILSRAWQIEDRYSVSWWDSLIAAAALSLDCRFLLTDDLQDGLRIDTLTVLDPFTHRPDSVAG